MREGTNERMTGTNHVNRPLRHIGTMWEPFRSMVVVDGLGKVVQLLFAGDSHFR